MHISSRNLRLVPGILFIMQEYFFFKKRVQNIFHFEKLVQNIQHLFVHLFVQGKVFNQQDPGSSGNMLT